MGEIEIRDATLADAKLMARIRVASRRFAYREFMPASYLDSQQQADEVLREIQREFEAARPGSCGHVAYLGAEPVGMTWVVLDPPGYPDLPQRSAVLGSLYLTPSAIGTGLGRILFWHALGVLASGGFDEAYLMTYAPNARARGFYEAMGWQPDGYEGTRHVDWPAEPFEVVSVRYRGPTRPPR
jgi:GNAT superfamily N-acetyltransferase